MRKDILIVEDEKMMLLVTKSALKKSNLAIGEIYEAQNGREGITTLETHNVDMIITDINMPVMDGMQMLLHICAQSDFIGIPTVVVTTENDPGLVDTLAGWGVGYLHKPFSQAGFEELILNVERNSYAHSLCG